MAGLLEVRMVLERVLGSAAGPFPYAFWRGLTRDELVDVQLLGRPLFVAGQPEESHLLTGLRDPATSPLRAFLGHTRATPDDLATLETWIRDGCPQTSPTLGSFSAQDADDHHTAYWRAIDIFFHPARASQETLKHVQRMHGAALAEWAKTMVTGNDPQAWPGYLAQPEVAESLAYIRLHQRRLLVEHYGGTQEATFDSLWKFGGNLLPIDPQHPLPGLQHHRMNGVIDWFFWAPYLDASLRQPDATDIDLDLARGWQLGIVADGLLRDDAERQGRRMPIPDFDASDPNLRDTVTAKYVQADGPTLINEMVRRARDWF